MCCVSPKAITNPEEVLTQNVRYLHIIAMVWIAALLIATLVSQKLFQIGSLTLSAYVFIYPISYICSDFFTEVYGYRRSRQIVWTGFIVLACAAFIFPVLAMIPAAKDYADQDAFAKIFMQAPLFIIAAPFAFFTGELTNSFVLAKMKIAQKGKHYHVRSLFSSLAGQTMDQLVYVLIAFVPLGLYDLKTLVSLVFSSALACVVIEAIKFPISEKIMRAVKKAEGLDVYDVGTDFNPFAVFKERTKDVCGMTRFHFK